MFDTRNELLNLISIVSMSLVFLDPDGTIGTGDLANHDNLYMGFAFEQSLVTGSFSNHICGLYEEEEEWFL